MTTIFRKIPVSKRLPSDDGDYFVYVHNEDTPAGNELVSVMHFSPLVRDIWLKEVAYWLEEIESTDWNKFRACFYDYYSLGHKTREDLFGWIKNFLSIE